MLTLTPQAKASILAMDYFRILDGQCPDWSTEQVTAHLNELTRTCMDAGLDLKDVLRGAGEELSRTNPAMADRLVSIETSAERGRIRAARFGG